MPTTGMPPSAVAVVCYNLLFPHPVVFMLLHSGIEYVIPDLTEGIIFMQYILLAFAFGPEFVLFLTPYPTGLMSYCAPDLVSRGVDVFRQQAFTLHQILHNIYTFDFI